VTFGGFTFASDVLLGRIAAFYGFSVPEAENETSLADSLRARLQGKPKLGDHISFTDKRLVIQDMDGERITKVGLELDPVAPIYLAKSESAPLVVPLHRPFGCS
jgi:cell volume regulation protein A